MSAIVDVQGFKDNQNKFIVKEIAILTSENKFQHFIFQPPFAFKDLTNEAKKQVKWVKNNLHGFDWYDGYIPYHHLYTIVPTLLHGKTIFVKGQEKIEWIKEFVTENIYIVDVEDELECPKLSWLKFVNQNISCISHKGLCALQNVFNIKNFLVSKK